MIDAETLEKNLQIFYTNLEKTHPRHHLKLKQLYDSAEELALAPASPVEYYHNAFPGGYVDHVNRVVAFSETVYYLWSDLSIDLSGFTLEELLFVAINHDLGKLGFQNPNSDDKTSPAGEYYKVNNDQWSRSKLQKVYAVNEEIPFIKVPDLGIFTLQQAGISLSWNEYQGIKLHDGLYDDSNKPYFFAQKEHSKLKNKLPYIIHMADHMATLREYDAWKTPKEVVEDFAVTDDLLSSLL